LEGCDGNGFLNEDVFTRWEGETGVLVVVRMRGGYVNDIYIRVID
jgi:hypothetical protein